MTEAVPQILIRDDGDLHEIRSLLDDIGVEYAEEKKGSPIPMPSHLLITSGQWAIDTLQEINRRGPTHHFLHLVVIDRASRSLQTLLERHGCDMVARRPIHPTVLRLLVQRSLYRGDERRQLERVAVGATVKLKSGLLSRSATLAEMSLRGCGIISRHAFEVGREIKISLPADLTGGPVMVLTGRVVGGQRSIPVEDGRHGAAVVFTSITRGERRLIQKIMDARALGHTGQMEKTPGTPIVAPKERPAEKLAKAVLFSADERRTTPRHGYEQSVLARGAGTTHSLIGRDLSLGGMRIVQESDLRLGDQLQLAIYGTAGVPPVIVKAEVVRDDGEAGQGLSFKPLHGPARSRLQTIVEGLDGLDEVAAKSGTVVGEILEGE